MPVSDHTLDQPSTSQRNARETVPLAAYVCHLVAGMPPLTEEQRAQLALIIRGSDQAESDAVDVPLKKVA